MRLFFWTLPLLIGLVFLLGPIYSILLKSCILASSFKLIAEICKEKNQINKNLGELFLVIIRLTVISAVSGLVCMNTNPGQGPPSGGPGGGPGGGPSGEPGGGPSGDPGGGPTGGPGDHNKSKKYPYILPKGQSSENENETGKPKEVQTDAYEIKKLEELKEKFQARSKIKIPGHNIFNDTQDSNLNLTGDEKITIVKVLNKNFQREVIYELFHNNKITQSELEELKKYDKYTLYEEKKTE
jgi:hypothetical protein